MNSEEKIRIVMDKFNPHPNSIVIYSFSPEDRDALLMFVTDELGVRSPDLIPLGTNGSVQKIALGNLDTEESIKEVIMEFLVREDKKIPVEIFRGDPAHFDRAAEPVDLFPYRHTKKQ
jgi:hypothetical protein